MARKIFWISLILFILSACVPSVEQNDQLRVVATTTIIGDIVSQVGGDQINLTVLLPVGSDPHSFQATPKDLAMIADADIVFLNGLGLEEFLGDLVKNAGGDAIVISLSENIPNLLTNEEDDRDGERFDPHVWLNPANISFWLEKIQTELIRSDPENTSFYQENSDAYQLELNQLEDWILDQVATIPLNQRIMVADHYAWGYFAKAYGFELAGTVIPGYSTLAEPSARELAALEELISATGVSAIFVGISINPDLSARVALDTGIELVALYTGSLSSLEGPAANYITMMRHNVELIVESIN